MFGYDIEVYKNFFSATFVDMAKSNDKSIKEYIDALVAKDPVKIEEALAKLDHHVFVIGHGRNDIYALRDFLMLKPTLVGYNSLGYDDIVMQHVVSNLHLDVDELTKLAYRASCEVINSTYISKDHEFYRYTANKPFISIDLMKLFHLRKALKMVAIMMKYPFIQDLPIEPHSLVKEHEVEGLLHYNLNDVLITIRMLKLKKDELQSRIDAMNMYKLEGKVLSSSRPELTKAIISSYIQKVNGGDRGFEWKKTQRRYIKFDEIVLNFDFQIPEFAAFYNHVKSIKLLIGMDSFSEVFKYNGVEYQFGVGGLHTKDRPEMFREDEDYEYVEIDADSYYPWLVINHEFEPKHLKGLFLPIFRLIVNTRMTAKKAGKAKIDEKDAEKLSKLIDEKVKNKKLANILKIAVNSAFGQFNDQYSFLFDPLCMYQTTVNGQIGLLYVAEKIILAGHEVISVNTDGVVAKIKKDTKESYYKDSEKAFLDFQATSEFTRYQLYVRTSVNDYLTIKDDGDLKLKGDFEYDKLVLHDGYSKSFNMPIVALSVVKYFTKGIPVKQTIKEHRDIYDFCKSVNVGGQYRMISKKVVNGEFVEEEVQKHIRFYVSNTGGSLVKVDRGSGKTNQLVAKRASTIFNDYVHHDNFNDYGVNYGYYISEANKLIQAIERTTTKSIKKFGGTLFD